MEILSEKTTKVVNMTVDLEDKEYELLYDYAKDKMPKKVLDDFLIGWAVGDLLRSYIEKLDKKPASKKRVGKGNASTAPKVDHDLDPLAGTWDEKDVKEFNNNSKITKRTKK